jgi:hypothetical protein
MTTTYDEPLEHSQMTLLSLLGVRDGSEEVRTLAPVGRELGERHRREDEGWGGERREVS